jgi:hypothetical protein
LLWASLLLVSLLASQSARGEDLRLRLAGIAPEHLVLLLDGELYRNSDQILVGELPPLVSFFAPSLEGVAIRGSVAKGSSGAAVLSLERGAPRLEQLLGDLQELGWIERDPRGIGLGLPGALSGDRCFCRESAGACIQRGREVGGALDLRVAFRTVDIVCNAKRNAGVIARAREEHPLSWLASLPGEGGAESFTDDKVAVTRRVDESEALSDAHERILARLERSGLRRGVSDRDSALMITTLHGTDRTGSRWFGSLTLRVASGRQARAATVLLDRQP